MKLYLMRHGDYVLSDPVQSLSRQGMKDAYRVFTYLKKMECEITAIWHSPKVRAAQTADIAGEIFPGALKKERVDLTPNADTGAVLDDLNKTESDLLIVSHLPFIPNLLARLIPDQDQIRTIGTAAVIVLERVGDQWKPVEVITPQSVF